MEKRTLDINGKDDDDVDVVSQTTGATVTRGGPLTVFSRCATWMSTNAPLSSIRAASVPMSRASTLPGHLSADPALPVSSYKLNFHVFNSVLTYVGIVSLANLLWV